MANRANQRRMHANGPNASPITQLVSALPCKRSPQAEARETPRPGPGALRYPAFAIAHAARNPQPPLPPSPETLLRFPPASHKAHCCTCLERNSRVQHSALRTLQHSLHCRIITLLASTDARVGPGTVGQPMGGGRQRSSSVTTQNHCRTEHATASTSRPLFIGSLTFEPDFGMCLLCSGYSPPGAAQALGLMISAVTVSKCWEMLPPLLRSKQYRRNL